jgi:putative membrane protein
MEPWQWWWPGMGFMWIFPLLFLIVMIVFLFRGPWWGGRGHDQGDRRETPREILDRRYAGGEITKEQYEEMKRTLVG